MVSTVKVASVACAVAEFEDTVRFLDSLPGEVSKVEEMSEKKKLLSLGAMAFMDLKRTTRASLLGAEEVRKEIEALKKEVDKEFVKVSSLEYRQARLAGEVEVCEKFDCPNLSRVVREASREISFVDDASAVKQTERLEGLDFELKERARLVDLVEKARARKREVERELRSSRAALDSLPKLLEALGKAAEPLAQVLSAKKRKAPLSEQDLGAVKNNKSLFVLLGMLSQCADAFEPLTAVVEVEENSILLKLGEKTALTFYEPMDDASSSAQQKTAGVDVAVRAEFKSDFLNPNQFLLDNLFPEEINWIESLVDGRLSHRTVFDKLSKRVQAKQALDSQLSLLHRRPPTYLVHDNFKRTLYAPTDSLKAWAAATAPTLDSHEASSTLQRYQATFQNNRATLKVFVDIPPDYPDRAPLFQVSHSSFAPSTAFRDIERELNAQYDSLVDDQSILNLLSHQLAKLNQIFVLILANNNHSAPSSNGGATSRARRGRDRRRTLLAAPELQHALVHRIM